MSAVAVISSRLAVVLLLAASVGLAGCDRRIQEEEARHRAAVDAYNNRRDTPQPPEPVPEMAALEPQADPDALSPEPAPVEQGVAAAAVTTAPAAKAAGGVGAEPSVAIAAPPPTPVVRAGGLPAGPGRDTVQRVCTSCHAIGMVTAKGRTSDGWSEIIGRMMGLGLEASDEDLQTVHAYLTRELPPR